MSLAFIELASVVLLSLSVMFIGHWTTSLVVPFIGTICMAVVSGGLAASQSRKIINNDAQRNLLCEGGAIRK